NTCPEPNCRCVRRGRASAKSAMERRRSRFFDRSTDFMAASLPADARRSLRLYNLFFPLFFIALLPSYLLRMFRRGGFRERFAQRFGRYSTEEKQRFASGTWLWLHSISVGETMLALKLARQIRAQNPTMNIALSVTTSTGFAVAREAACEWIKVIYNPLD